MIKNKSCARLILKRNDRHKVELRLKKAGIDSLRDNYREVKGWYKFKLIISRWMDSEIAHNFLKYESGYDELRGKFVKAKTLAQLQSTTVKEMELEFDVVRWLSRLYARPTSRTISST